MTTPKSSRPLIRGIVFDMDGTLTVPNLDFTEMYRRCRVSPSDDILTAISNMPESQAAEARAIIDEMEEEGRRTLQLAPGALELGQWLRHHNIPTGLVTRNTAKTVEWMVERLWVSEPGMVPFYPAISRDVEDVPHKPDPASLAIIAKEWGSDLDNGLLMVGDSIEHDIVFGKNAGVSTALVNDVKNCGVNDSGADICVSGLCELPQRIWDMFEIGGSLGTNVPLMKYDTPVPTSKACVAAVEGNVEELALLSAEELNVADESGNTPLIWAADAGYLKAVELILDVPGVDMDVQGYIGNTAVSRASRNGHAEILHLLAKNGANLDICNKKLQYPLHFAAFKKKKHALDVLLESGASTLVLDRKGRTPAEDTSDEDIRETILAKRKETLRQHA
eukprot:CAMPEP_0172490102 /NCGR_PEP_ID=MMETSP1066-20121228/20445_1 /TAXON_ID=671091 /ORGANISM="Coscinodiscus wailesii, Strain CCMP2513" /LENGTH=391 /DNA_ID=CAMNT_0013258409 /DNA_START=79 /DNA_END=1254 /DNA_ORIENTATION=+